MTAWSPPGPRTRPHPEQPGMGANAAPGAVGELTHGPRIVVSPRSCTTNPLKHSAPLGGALAFMGLEGCLPLLHGSQGCTAFALVLMVRHFRESIPLQTTAMNEITTILGGLDTLEQALLTIRARAHPKVIGICTTGLTETRGEDFRGDLQIIRTRRPELADTALVLATTPDFAGGLQEGWGKAVTAIVEQLVEPSGLPVLPNQVNLLTPSHFSPSAMSRNGGTAPRRSAWSRSSCPIFPPRSTAICQRPGAASPWAARHWRTSAAWTAPP
ncbi:MAG: nitrogenase molybdenum-iron protein NifN [Rhodospirillaceae bacterium]|nr:MAG: nitrogenase molybdenum-iron protein NifN [Rhodospirillaceae bacterium]